MAGFNTTFARKEVKYRLSAQQLEGIIEEISPKMMPDEYGESLIVSNYYDTPGRDLIARSLEKPLYKEKLRVRSYGEAGPNDRVFVEIKKKFKGIVYKRRLDMSCLAAQSYFEGLGFEEANNLFPIVDEMGAPEISAAK